MGSDRSSKLQTAVDNLVHVIMELREADKGDDTGLPLGELIARERDNWGYSLQDVANRTRMSKAHIWVLERSKAINPTAEVIGKLADALCLPPIQVLNAALTSQRIMTALSKDQHT